MNCLVCHISKKLTMCVCVRVHVFKLVVYLLGTFKKERLNYQITLMTVQMYISQKKNKVKVTI